MKTRTVMVFSALVLTLVVLVAGPAYAASVSIGDNFYNPSTVSIGVGESVTWTNDGSAPHTVTANDGSFDSSPNCPSSFDACMQPGETYTHTFDAAGTFGYFCKVHGQSMSGTVVVGEGGSPAPSGSGGLPNTGPGDGLIPFAILGGAFLLAGAVALYLLRRRGAA